jgi:FKBP-type peptidyl-prolyl isomerase-like protein
VRRFALLLLPVLLAGSLGACSGDSSSGLPHVSGKFGDKPKVTVEKGSKPDKKLDVSVLSKGSGHKVAKGDLLVADYLGKVYKSGKVFDNSYDRKVPAAFPIGTGAVIPAWDKALVGVKTGSRVLMVVPPKQGYGKKGNPQAKIKGTDSLVFVVDVIASYPKTGTPEKNTPVAGLPADLPKSSGPSGTEPTLTVPKGTTPPKSPKTTVLAKGSGPVVAKGKLAIIQYTAVNWAGKPLSSSWSQGPQGVPIGGPQPSPFDLLTGVPTGSRVLLSLPAQTGANPATDSVAVVIDVLGLQGPAKDAVK